MKQTWRDDPQVQGDPVLTAALEDLAQRAGQPVDDVTRARTVRAMATAAGGDATDRTGRWARRGRRAAGLAVVKVLAAASVAAATTGGLATQGMLPDTVQETLHDLGARIGLQLPPGSPPPAVDPAGADEAPAEPPAVDHDLPDDADVRRQGPAVRGGHGRPPARPDHASRPDDATPPDHAPDGAGDPDRSEVGGPADPPPPAQDRGGEGGPPNDVSRGPAAPAGR